jgi:hypothetical protein
MLSEVSALSEQFDKLDAALGSSKALHKDARLRKGSMPGALSSGNLDASLLGHPHETSPTDFTAHATKSPKTKIAHAQQVTRAAPAPSPRAPRPAPRADAPRGSRRRGWWSCWGGRRARRRTRRCSRSSRRSPSSATSSQRPRWSWCGARRCGASCAATCFAPRTTRRSTVPRSSWLVPPPPPSVPPTHPPTVPTRGSLVLLVAGAPAPCPRPGASCHASPPPRPRRWGGAPPPRTPLHLRARRRRLSSGRGAGTVSVRRWGDGGPGVAERRRRRREWLAGRREACEAEELLGPEVAQRAAPETLDEAALHPHAEAHGALREAGSVVATSAQLCALQLSRAAVRAAGLLPAVLSRAPHLARDAEQFAALLRLAGFPHPSY